MGTITTTSTITRGVATIAWAQTPAASPHPDEAAQIEQNLLADLRARAAAAGLDDAALHFHGFVEDHRRVEALLAGASVAVAPYVEDATSFTRFAEEARS